MPNVEVVVWFVFVVLTTATLMSWIVLGTVLARLRRLEARTEPLICYTEHDRMLEEFAAERAYDERRWRNDTR